MYRDMMYPKSFYSPLYDERLEYIKGARGVFMIFFSEIDFLIVSDRGDQYLSDAFGPMKK